MENGRQRVEFACEHCGRTVKVPAAYAGKRGRCPGCREVVTVPAASEDAPVTEATSPFHEALLDMPKPEPEAEAAPTETREDDTASAYEQLRAAQGGRLYDPEEAPRRKLPWILDIFLYPLNGAGMVVLLICAGGPFVLRTVTRFFFIFMAKVGPFFVFWVLFIILHWGGLLLFVLYINWYVCECIRDSAAGGIRAADTTATTPGLGEMFLQAFRVLLCALAVMAPALIYWLRVRSVDPIFSALYAAGGFVFPMALLAVVMHESIRALNPFLLVTSILKTLIRYTALVVVCYFVCILLPIVGFLLFTHWWLAYPAMFLAFYMLLVLAHLLGRLYWRAEEKLYWDT